MTLDADTLLSSTTLPEKARRDVPRVINRLLGQTFLYQDVDTDKDDYYFVHRHREVIEAVAATGGFQPDARRLPPHLPGRLRFQLLPRALPSG